MAMLPSLEKERDRIYRDIAAADKVLDDAAAQHYEVTGPLHDALAQIRDGVKTFRSRDSEWPAMSGTGQAE